MQAHTQGTDDWLTGTDIPAPPAIDPDEPDQLIIMHRTGTGALVGRWFRKGVNFSPEELPHVERHCPTGFDMGAGGDGAADLALAICTAFLGAALAEQCYQAFKWDVLSNVGVSAESWSIFRSAVVYWWHNRKQEG